MLNSGFPWHNKCACERRGRGWQKMHQFANLLCGKIGLVYTISSWAEKQYKRFGVCTRDAKKTHTVGICKRHSSSRVV